MIALNRGGAGACLRRSTDSAFHDATWPAPNEGPRPIAWMPPVLSPFRLRRGAYETPVGCTRLGSSCPSNPKDELGLRRFNPLESIDFERPATFSEDLRGLAAGHMADT